MKNRKPKYFWLFFLLLALTACSEDDATEPQVTVDPPPPNPELLVEDFSEALDGEDIARLDWLLNEDFHMEITPDTIYDWEGGSYPLLTDFFDHDGFLAIHGHIFADSTGVDPYGNSVSRITGISVDLMEKVGTWEQVDPEMEYFGDFEEAFSCRWSVLIHFNLEANYRFEVDNLVRLVARPVTVGEDSGWELLGIIPLSYSAGNKTATLGWDNVLALYR